MARIQSELSWLELDHSEIAHETVKLLAEYKAAYKLMKEARSAFEQAAADDMGTPDGKCWKFGYLYGKVSVALAPKAEAKAAPKPKLSLTQYLKQQAQ